MPWHAVGRILSMADTPSRRTKARSMVSKTARMMTKYATDEWERRCTAVLEEEKQNGIHDRKVVAGRQKWVLQVEGPQRRRGRPPKDPSDLNVAYQRAKESRVKKRELMESHGVDIGTALHSQWVRTRMKGEQIANGLTGTQGIKTMLTEHALWDDRDAWEEQAAARTERLILLRNELLEELPYESPTDGTCVVQGCHEQGQYVNTGCENAAARCRQHWGVSCWGDWRGCSCWGERPSMQTKHGSTRKRSKKPPAEKVRRQDLLDRFCTGEDIWVRAALHETDHSTVVTGKLVYVIQEPSLSKLKTPSARTKWRPPSEIYVQSNGEEVSVILDGLDWAILSNADWEGLDLDTPDCSDGEGTDSDDGSAGDEDHGIDAPPDEAFAVEQILKRRHGAKGVEYYVRWEGYGEEDNNWEHEDNLGNRNRGENTSGPDVNGGHPAQSPHREHAHVHDDGGRMASGRFSLDDDGGDGEGRAEDRATQTHRANDEEARGGRTGGSQEDAVSEGCRREESGQGARGNGGWRVASGSEDDEGRHRNAPRVCTRSRLRTAGGTREDENEGRGVAPPQPRSGPQRAATTGGGERRSAAVS